MGCDQCGADAATRNRVSCTTGEAELLELCRECREAFSRGDLVRDVTPGNG